MPTVIVGLDVTKISAYRVQAVDRRMIPVSDLSPRGFTWTVENVENSVVARAPVAEGAVLRTRPVSHLVPTALATGRSNGCRKPVGEPDASVRSTLLSRPC